MHFFIYFALVCAGARLTRTHFEMLRSACVWKLVAIARMHATLCDDKRATLGKCRVCLLRKKKQVEELRSQHKTIGERLRGSTRTLCRLKRGTMRVFVWCGEKSEYRVFA